MNAKQWREFAKELARRSHGKATEYAVMVKGERSAVFPAIDTAKYKKYLSEGYTHAASVLDGNAMELF